MDPDKHYVRFLFLGYDEADEHIWDWCIDHPINCPRESYEGMDGEERVYLVCGPETIIGDVGDEAFETWPMHPDGQGVYELVEGYSGHGEDSDYWLELGRKIA